jgi:cobyrinic acid a,c-diamide synthase
MDMKSVPAILIGGTKSGSGKTIITLGIMKAFMMRGLVVQPYKCGPDFIDPSLHGWITGRTSYNLDIIMMGKPACRDLVARTSYDADIIVVEGKRRRMLWGSLTVVRQAAQNWLKSWDCRWF